MGHLAAAGFRFNGWGRKYLPCDDDDALKTRLSQHLGIPIALAEPVLEGGAISVDGEGTLLTTEECLLHPSRNPGWTKADYEVEFRERLGIEKVIWLGKGVVPDPITDGHVDGLCVFVAPGVVMLHTTGDRGDPNHAICEDARERLMAARDAAGRGLEIIELPLGWTICHVNFYVCNGGVVVPLSGDAAEDDTALGIIADAFPGRRVVGVGGTVMGEGGGGVHCITMQLPAGG